MMPTRPKRYPSVLKAGRRIKGVVSPLPASRILHGLDHRGMPVYSSMYARKTANQRELLRGASGLNIEFHENFFSPRLNPSKNGEPVHPAPDYLLRTATRARALDKLVRQWTSPSGVRLPDKVKLGEGAYGYISAIPGSAVSIIQRSPRSFGISSWITPSRRAPTNKLLAVKFQVLKDQADLNAAVTEGVNYKLLRTRKVSTARGIPAVHNYVPEFYGAGIIKSLGLHVIFMEYVQGSPMDKWMPKMTPGLYTKAERALAALWARGFAHGDMHGGNMFVTSQGKPILIDFGLLIPLPRSLRPTSMAEARSAPYLAKLEAYIHMRRAQEGYPWHNPNTRFLKVARAHIPARLNARGRGNSASQGSVSRTPSSRNTSSGLAPMNWSPSSGEANNMNWSPINPGNYASARSTLRSRLQKRKRSNDSPTSNNFRPKSMRTR